MATFRDDEFSQALQSTQRRLERSRRRRRQEWWTVAATCAAIAAFAALAVAARRSAPAPPRLIVTWSEPPGSQTLPSGATVLVRPGEPLTVSVDHPERWQLVWTAGAVRGTGRRLDWSPAKDNALLTVQCSLAGWRRLSPGSWFHPAFRLLLHGQMALEDGDLARRVTPPADGIWLAPAMVAQESVTWDERALSLLNQVSSHGDLWEIVASFGGERGAGDTGTYARLAVPAAETTLPAIASAVAAKDPSVSIKFVVHLDEQPASGVLRLAFDGKGHRAGWVKRPGAAGAGESVWPPRS